MFLRIACHLLCLLRTMEIMALRMAMGLRRAPAADDAAPPWALIVRNDFLGDLIISVGAIRALCRYFHGNGYRVALVLNDRNREVGDAFPDCDSRIYLASHAGIRQRWREYSELHRLRPEIAVRMPCAIGSDIRASWATLLSGALICHGLQPQLLTLSSEGMDSSVSATNGQGFLKRLVCQMLSKRTRLELLEAWRYRPFKGYFASQLPVDTSKSIAENEAQLVSLIAGGRNEQCLPDRMEWLDAAVVPQELSRLLPADGVSPFYVMVTGASQVNRTWELPKFAQVVRRLAVLHPEMHLVLCGTAAEDKAADEVIRLAGQEAMATNLCGRTTLAQLCAILRRATVVISNETGTAHLAAALNAPLCLLLGGGLRGLHSPSPLQERTEYVTAGDMPCARCNWLCHRLDAAGRPPCLVKIDVEDVIQKVERLLCAWH